MNAAQILYNAARHYCIDKRVRWSSQYDALENQLDALRDNAGAIFPRALVNTIHATVPRFHALGAILMDIESIDSDALPEYSELEELLMLAASTAENEFTKDRHTSTYKAAIEDERKKFAESLRTLTADAAANIPPLPYRRLLSGKELSTLWGRLKASWGAEPQKSYFYPLLGERSNPTLCAFDSHAFTQEFPPPRLRTILDGWGVSRIYELRELWRQELPDVDRFLGSSLRGWNRRILV